MMACRDCCFLRLSWSPLPCTQIGANFSMVDVLGCVPLFVVELFVELVVVFVAFFLIVVLL